jgi:hypothetical protein
MPGSFEERPLSPRRQNPSLAAAGVKGVVIGQLLIAIVGIGLRLGCVMPARWQAHRTIRPTVVASMSADISQTI